jgi:hypothetical protein
VEGKGLIERSCICGRSETRLGRRPGALKAGVELHSLVSLVVLYRHAFSKTVLL